MTDNPYESPKEASPNHLGMTPESDAPEDSSDDGLKSALKVGLLINLSLFALTALLLDGGITHRYFRLAMVGFLIGAAVILIRRRNSPSALDLLYIRFGVIPLWIASLFVARIVYAIIGESTESGWQRWF